MSDLISRQAAIDALGEKPLAWTEGEYELGLQNQWQSDVDTLKALPSAQPERKTGKCKWCERLKERNLRIEYYWIDQEGCTASFSEPHIVATGIAKFCPNCGAKMEGDAE